MGGCCLESQVISKYKHNKYNKYITYITYMVIGLLISKLAFNNDKYLSNASISIINTIVFVSISILSFNIYKLTKNKSLYYLFIIYLYTSLISTIGIYLLYTDLQNNYNTFTCVNLMISLLQLFGMVIIYTSIKESKIIYFIYLIPLLIPIILFTKLFINNSFDYLYYILVFISIMGNIIYFIKLHKESKNLNKTTYYKLICFLVFNILSVLTSNFNNSIYLCLGLLSTICIYKSSVGQDIKTFYGSLNINQRKLNSKLKSIEKNNYNITKEILLQEKIREEISLLNNDIENSIKEVSTPIFLIDNENKITYINEAFYRVFGQEYKVDNDIDVRDFMKNVFYNVDLFIESIRSIKINSDHNYHNLYSKDGKIFKCTYLLDKNENNLRYTVCILNDITQSITLERMLKESEEQYKNLMDTLNDAVFIHDFEKSHYINKVAKTVFDVDNNVKLEIILNNVLPHYKEKLLHNMKDIYLKKKDKSKLIMKTNSDKYLEIITTSLNINNQELFLTIVTDITKREKAKLELEENEKTYRYLIEALPEGVFIIERNTLKCTYINKIMAEMLSLDNIEDIYIEENQEQIKRISKEYLDYNAYGKFIKCKLTTLNKVIDVSMALITFDDNDGSNLVGIVRNLEEENKTREVKLKFNKILEHDKIKTEFLANISQELKRPLNLVFAVNQLLESKNSSIYNSNHIENYNRLVKQNCYRLIRLINNINDITQMENGFYEINLRNHNIISLVEDIVFSVNDYIRNKGLEVIFDTEVEDKIISIDPEKIERIMLNLLSNAIKFTNLGGKIYVNIYMKNKKVYISIKDTGVGIPKDKLNLIFERFGQVDKTLSRNAEGSGIGLSLAKYLVELHLGRIEVNSEEGKGSEFIVVLPDTIVDEAKFDEENNNYISNNVEKMHIEFADIYFNTKV
jgi:PAS domain S-box-containing protein